MKLIAESMSPNRTKVLLALVHLYELHGNVSMTDVAIAAGLSRSCTYSHLKALRVEGFCDWESGTLGTLRPLVSEVWPVTADNAHVSGVGGEPVPGVLTLESLGALLPMAAFEEVGDRREIVIYTGLAAATYDAEKDEWTDTVDGLLVPFPGELDR